MTASSGRSATWVVLCLAGWWAPAGPGSSVAPAAPVAAAPNPLREAIRRLTAEAGEVMAGRRTLGDQADFADRFELPLEGPVLAEAIARPAHRDPFVDAYVRWQLTSFDPALADLDEKRFADLARRAPRLIENPRAERKAVSTFRRAAAAGPLPQRDRDRLREMEAEFVQRTARARRLNRPATSFRAWVQEKLGAGGPRPRQWLLAWCAATINAGWSTRSIKTAITRGFGAGGLDPSFTTSQRRLVAEQARHLIGRRRVAINKVTFMADGSVRVTFSTAGVDAGDVRRWVEALGVGVREPDADS